VPGSTASRSSSSRPWRRFRRRIWRPSTSAASRWPGANDRASNQQISYLLQRIEDFPGVVILATNLRSHLHEAFARRSAAVLPNVRDSRRGAPTAPARTTVRILATLPIVKSRKTSNGAARKRRLGRKREGVASSHASWRP
jgi:hypothetical protein